MNADDAMRNTNKKNIHLELKIDETWFASFFVTIQ